MTAFLAAVDLVGSRLERQEDGGSCAGVLGGRDGGRLATGAARGSAQAAARRAPQGLRRGCQSGRGECPAALAPARQARPPVALPARARCPRDDALDGARRSPRALKTL
jgi:hypothetical protein